MLCCLGDLVEDIAVIRPHRVYEDADTDVRIERRRGGSAANVAVAAARAGSHVRFIGRVGDDGIGWALVEDLGAEGVEPVVQRSGRTGTIVVMVAPGGERTMFRDRAAAADLDRLVEPGLRGVSWLHVPAYSLVDGVVAGVAIDALNTARAMGAGTSVDASSVTIVEQVGAKGFRDLLESLDTDVTFCNAREFAALGSTPLKGRGVTVVKDGAGPATALDENGLVRSSAPAETINDVTDTTGAGDAFAAGYVLARLDGSHDGDALATGHRVASQWIRRR